MAMMSTAIFPILRVIENLLINLCVLKKQYYYTQLFPYRQAKRDNCSILPSKKPVKTPRMAYRWNILLIYYFNGAKKDKNERRTLSQDSIALGFDSIGPLRSDKWLSL
jgi:hypothetical protein